MSVQCSSALSVPVKLSSGGLSGRLSIMAASSICHALWHHRCRRMPYLVNAASASSYSMSLRVMG